MRIEISTFYSLFEEHSQVGFPLSNDYSTQQVVSPDCSPLHECSRQSKLNVIPLCCGVEWGL